MGRIYVLPAYWGEGIGTTLLQQVFGELRQAGHEGDWLAVMAENDLARSFYDAHGFERHEKRTVDLAGQSVDDLVLVREL
nr:GNAT family N-acetyltransferase [Natronococcus amylolyticus]